MKKIAILGLAAALSMAAISAPALADEAGTASAGVSAGMGKLGDFDNSSFGFKLFGAYQVGKNIALEGGFARIAGDSTISGVKVNGTDDAFYVAPVVNFEVSKGLTAFGKLNLAYNMAKADAMVCGYYGCQTGSASENEFKVGWGVGAELQVAPKISIRAEYETFAADISLFSAGVRVAF